MIENVVGRLNIGRKKISQEKLDQISKEIHWYLSYSTLAIYHSMLKAVDTKLDDETREKALESAQKLVTNAETLYEDLLPEQKDIYHSLAYKLIEIMK